MLNYQFCSLEGKTTFFVEGKVRAALLSPRTSKIQARSGIVYQLCPSFDACRILGLLGLCL